MKKYTRRILSLCLLAVLIVTLAVPAAAAGDPLTLSMTVGDEQSLLFSDDIYVSSNPSVVEVIPGDREYVYIAVAKGVGEATLTGTWAGKEQVYHITVTESVTPTLNQASSNSDFMEVFILPVLGIMTAFGIVGLIPTIIAICFILLMFISMIVMVIYIFIDAPKHGMTRFWALLPLALHVLALAIYLIVRTNRKNSPAAANSKHTVTCPTCNSVHPKGTAQCDICGTELK